MLLKFIRACKAHPLYCKHRHFILYGFIAVSGVILDVGVFLLCYYGFGLEERIAQVIGAHVGFVNNFLWNAFHNFKKTDRLFRRFLSYYGTSLVGILIRDQAMRFFGGYLGYNAAIVQITALFCVAFLQFFVNKIFTFRAHHPTTVVMPAINSDEQID